MQNIEYSTIEVSGFKFEVSAYKEEKAYRLLGSKGTWFFPDSENSDDEIIAYLIERELYPSVQTSVRTITLAVR